jgi:hypothetical protein
LYNKSRNVKKRLFDRFNKFAKILFRDEYDKVMNTTKKKMKKKKKQKKKNTEQSGINDEEASFNTSSEEEDDVENSNKDKSKNKKGEKRKNGEINDDDDDGDDNDKDNKNKKKKEIVSRKKVSLDFILNLQKLSKETANSKITSFEYSHTFYHDKTTKTSKTVTFTDAWLINLVTKSNNNNNIPKPTVLSCIIGLEQINSEIMTALLFKTPAYDNLRAIILLSPSVSEYVVDSTAESNEIVTIAYNKFVTLFTQMNPEWEISKEDIKMLYGNDEEDEDDIEHRYVYIFLFERHS